jgi:DNA-binding MarR family transcriptional regulator
MKPNGVNQNMYWLLIRVTMRAKHRILHIAEQYGLTLMQAHTLGLLEPGNPQPMNSLSGLLNCDASNVTGIVDRLETRGLIERRDKEDDRRVKMVVITVEGEKLRNQIISQLTELEEERLAKVLTLKEREVFRHALQKLAQAPVVD